MSSKILVAHQTEKECVTNLLSFEPKKLFLEKLWFFNFTIPKWRSETIRNVKADKIKKTCSGTKSYTCKKSLALRDDLISRNYWFPLMSPRGLFVRKFHRETETAALKCLFFRPWRCTSPNIRIPLSKFRIKIWTTNIWLFIECISYCVIFSYKMTKSFGPWEWQWRELVLTECSSLSVFQPCVQDRPTAFLKHWKPTMRLS